MTKIEFKILKDKKKDVKRMGKFGHKVTYPMFKARLNFNGKKLEFSKHDFGTTYLTINFPEKIKLSERMKEYGEDYISVGKDLIIFNYKYKGKNKRITSISIINMDVRQND